MNTAGRRVRSQDTTGLRRRSVPESVAQAAMWDRVKANALAFGLCHVDAAQLAYGHQEGCGGFAELRPPCPVCVEMLKALPSGRVNGWRTVAGAAAKPHSWQVYGVTARGEAPTPSPAADPSIRVLVHADGEV